MLNYANALPRAPWTETERSLASFLEDLRFRVGYIPELAKMRGWDFDNLLEDRLHDDLLGFIWTCAEVLSMNSASRAFLAPGQVLGVEKMF